MTAAPGASPPNKTPPPDDWLKNVIIRHAVYADLPGMEWEGEFTHFRRVYQHAFVRHTQGLSVLWVAELPDQGLIGQVFIQLNCDRPELADGKHRAYLFGFRVRPQYRNYGLGTRMVSIVENDLIAKGFNRITLNVARVNQSAINLYNRLGFLIVAIEPGIWSYQDENDMWHTITEPAWRMEKILPHPKKAI